MLQYGLDCYFPEIYDAYKKWKKWKEINLFSFINNHFKNKLDLSLGKICVLSCFWQGVSVSMQQMDAGCQPCFTKTLLDHSNLTIRGGSRIFKQRGRKRLWSHSNHKAQSLIRPRSRAYFKGLGSSRILDALSCYLSLIVTQNWFSKSTADQNLEGRAPLVPPPGSATDHVNSLQNIQKEIICTSC